jgi:hypothetical protein
MMNQERYRELAREICKCAELPPDDAFMESGMLNIDGWDTLLFYDEEFDPERLQIRIDLGEMPSSPGAPQVVMLSLLSTNFVYGLGGLSVFSINPSDGHIVLTTQHMIDMRTSAQDILAFLREAVGQARGLWEEVLGALSAMKPVERQWIESA